MLERGLIPCGRVQGINVLLNTTKHKICYKPTFVSAYVVLGFFFSFLKRGCFGS